MARKKTPDAAALSVPTNLAAFQERMIEEMERFQDGVLAIFEQRSKNNLARMKALEQEAAADDKADHVRDQQIVELGKQVVQIKADLDNKQDKIPVDEAKIRAVWERLQRNSERLAKLAAEEAARAKPFSKS